jgi:C_GCAxxG_C_C family probable redox protein
MKRREFMRVSTAGLATATGMLSAGHETRAAEKNETRESFRSPDPEDLAEAVNRHFIPGKKTCGEAMLLGSCEVLGIESPLVPDIALGMGGGIGVQGQVCGIVTGATMVTGIVVGSRETEYKKKKMRVFTACGKYLQSFEKKHGTLSCRRICGLDLTTPEGRAQLKKGLKVRRCAPVVQAGARMLGEVLRQDEENPSYTPPRSLLSKDHG